jgi:hypothetical protein
MAAFYDVETFDHDTRQVIVFTQEGPGLPIHSYEVAVCGAFGEPKATHRNNPGGVGRRLGTDGKPARTGSRANSDAHEIAGALNGGLMLAGQFDDSLPDQYAKQEAARILSGGA